MLFRSELKDVIFANVLTSYFVALTDAVDKIEGIDRSPKPKQAMSVAPIKTLDDLGDLPF